MTSPTTAIPLRSNIPDRYKWNREAIFPSTHAWEEEFDQVDKLAGEFERFKGHLAEGPQVLLEALRAADEINRRAIIVYMVGTISREVDATDQEATAMANKAQGLGGRARAAQAFVNPELLAIGRPTLEEWVQREPGLEVYRHMLDDLFRKQAHVRSAEVEELLGLLSDPFAGPENTASYLTNADMKFAPATNSAGEKVPVNPGSLYQIFNEPDREVRRTAYNSYTDTFLAFKNTLASNLANSIKQNVFMTRARRFSSTLEASLFDGNVPVEVFHNLIDTFKANLPTWHRYWQVRRKILGVDRLQPYDIWAPLTKDVPKVSFEQAVDWICAGLRPLGEDYVEAMRRGCLEERWVDIYPNQGKTAGAFSWGVQGTYPFIVMSYTDNVMSMSTLAHELGHSLHSYQTWQAQEFANSNYALFVAEVASNFHQAMVRAYLLDRNPDPAFQIALIEEAMSNFYRYFLIMPTLARFELEMHERVERGEGLTADLMIDRMAALFGEAYGEELQGEHDRVGITWATFMHLFNDYYVYQYATGISAAHALAGPILKGAPGAAENYRKFLASGGAVYPLDALRIAGVDLTAPQAVEETFKVLAGYVDRLENLL